MRHIGGVQLTAHKELTKDVAVREYNPDLTREYVYLVNEHIGTPGKVLVREGQHVNVGQMIVEAGKGISACLCSSVSGKVVSVLEDGRIVISNDRKYTAAPGMGSRRDYKKMSRQDILSIIRSAGVIGMGGAGFPTHIKYDVKSPESIRCIIPNDAECEPYITSDYRLMKECFEEVEGGLKILHRLFPHAELRWLTHSDVYADIVDAEDSYAVDTGTEDTDNADIDDVDTEAKDTDNEDAAVRRRIRLRYRGRSKRNTRYPHGAECQLIYEATGNKIAPGTIPSGAGYIVSNVHTLSAVYKAVCLGIPVTDRIVTVTGDGIKRPGNYRVRIGAGCRSLMEAAGGLTGRDVTVIAGGPMMGRRLDSLDVPVMRTTSGIVCLTSQSMHINKSVTACIRCGRCLKVCPVGLVPYNEKSQRECIGCGCCSYVCPAGRELTRAKYQKGGGPSA